MVSQRMPCAKLWSCHCCNCGLPFLSLYRYPFCSYCSCKCLFGAGWARSSLQVWSDCRTGRMWASLSLGEPCGLRNSRFESCYCRACHRWYWFADGFLRCFWSGCLRRSDWVSMNLAWSSASCWHWSERHLPLYLLLQLLGLSPSWCFSELLVLLDQLGLRIQVVIEVFSRSFLSGQLFKNQDSMLKKISRWEKVHENFTYFLCNPTRRWWPDGTKQKYHFVHFSASRMTMVITWSPNCEVAILE